MVQRSASLVLVAGCCLAFATLGACPAWAAPDARESALIPELRHGGYVIVMRHAHAPSDPPARSAADAANTGDERQLDAAGKASASAMGAALRRLRVPIGEVWSSPTYRARETARLAGLPAPHRSDALGDNGRSMHAADKDQATWLRDVANKPPKRGTDTVIVTQQPNIAAAFGSQADGLTDGEAMIFEPRKGGSPRLIGRIPMGDWPLLASDSP